MSSHVVVIDTSFRRTTIKLNPGTYLSDVLEDACKKFNLKSSNYGLKNNNRPVDLSRTFRQSGLSSGAKLELVVASKSPSVVSVALQLPEAEAKAVPGGRLMDKFPSNTSLWMILRKLETSATANLNFTGRGAAQTTSGSSGAGRIYYEEPVLNIMGRELSSFGDLQKTLAQLGLNSGSSLIRLSFRRTEQPLEEAMMQIGQYFKAVEEPTAPGAHASGPANSETVPAADDMEGVLSPDPALATPDNVAESSGSSEAAPPPLTPATPSEEASLPEETVVGPDHRPLLVFAPPSSETPKAALVDVKDDDFEPTVADAKRHQQHLQNRTHNQRLLSDAELARQEEEKAAKQAAIREVSIKIRFPDQLTAVASFTTLDTGAKLYEFVRGLMAAENEPFHLVWTGPKGPQTVPDSADIRLIRDLQFSGRMLVNLHWDEGASPDARTQQTLKAAYADQAKAIQVQEIAAAEAEEEIATAAASSKGKEPERGLGSGNKSKGVPKWLKLPGKK